MVTRDHLHAIAHTSRILRTLEEKPEHPRKAEYARQIRIYRGQWAALDPDEQLAAAAAVIADPEAADLTEETVAPAVAALNGDG
jgi:hypothetical protein